MTSAASHTLLEETLKWRNSRLALLPLPHPHAKAPSSSSVHPSSSINHRHSQMCHRLSFTSSLFVICGITLLYFLSSLGQRTSPVLCPSGIMIFLHEDLIKFEPLYPNLCAQQPSYSIEWILRSSSVQAEPEALWNQPHCQLLLFSNSLQQHYNRRRCFCESSEQM